MHTHIALFLITFFIVGHKTCSGTGTAVQLVSPVEGRSKLQVLLLSMLLTTGVSYSG